MYKTEPAVFALRFRELKPQGFYYFLSGMSGPVTHTHMI